MEVGPVGEAGRPVGQGCSADLRDVLAFDTTVLYTCAPTEGCFEGQCIEACDAASRSRGTIGCAFFVSSYPSYPGAPPPCLAAFVANAWDGPAVVTVERGGGSLTLGGFARIVDNARPVEEWAPVPATGIPAGEVAVLFLSSDPAAILPETGSDISCPVTPAVDASTVLSAGGVGDAFTIRASVPVRGYDMLPYGGAHSHFPSASLVLPASAWGVEYVVLAPPPGTHSAPGPMWLHVIAQEDGTMVRVRPTVDLPAAPPLPAVMRGATATFVLGAGQYAHWEMGAADPSGTIVVADRPVAVVSGNRFLRLQREPAPGGDSAHQFLLPVSALANEYVAAPYDTRRSDLAPELIRYRIVGAFDGTALTFDPAVPGAPAVVSRGEVVEVTSTGAFVVRSQDASHPFAMAQLMSSANLEVPSRPGGIKVPRFGTQLGDEEFVIVVPPAQYLSQYIFFSDPTYPTTSLVFVRGALEEGAFAPVTVDCLGEVTGWRPAGPGYEWTVTDLVRTAVGVGACRNGRHVASSTAPFGLVVWGLDTYSSYAYPAGGNARTLAPLPPLL